MKDFKEMKQGNKIYASKSDKGIIKIRNQKDSITSIRYLLLIASILNGLERSKSSLD